MAKIPGFHPKGQGLIPGLGGFSPTDQSLKNNILSKQNKKDYAKNMTAFVIIQLLAFSCITKILERF